VRWLKEVHFFLDTFSCVVYKRTKKVLKVTV
jgi:hypothetical protein